MPFNTTVTTIASTNLDYTYSSNISLSGSAKISINESIPTGSQNNFVNFNFSTGSGVFLGMASDVVGYSLRVKTNNSSTPINTFFISSTGTVLLFNFGKDLDSTGNLVRNFSGLFIDNAGTSVATFRLDGLYDITPGI